MDFKALDTVLLSLSGVTFEYPFDEKTRVYRVSDKMFALTSEDSLISVNLKCDPVYALELRLLYEGIMAGYHMNKSTGIQSRLKVVMWMKRWLKS